MSDKSNERGELTEALERHMKSMDDYQLKDLIAELIKENAALKDRIDYLESASRVDAYLLDKHIKENAELKEENANIFSTIQGYEKREVASREALKKIAKVKGSTDKVICLAVISSCAETAKQALEGEG